jgi:prepilin-type processing-associated H-X9-DG protein
MTSVLPFMEQQAAYSMLDFEIRPQWQSANNQTIMKMQFSFFFCPSDPYRGLTTPWGPPDETNEARICEYYAVAGSTEPSTMKHPNGAITYGHCNANDGIFFNDSTTRIEDIKDGTSNTAMFCESWGRSFPTHVAPAVILPGYPSQESSRGMNLHTAVYFDWTPNSTHINPWKPNSFHRGGLNIALADGSVRFVTDGVDLTTFKALSTIAGREVLDASKF